MMLLALYHSERYDCKILVLKSNSFLEVQLDYELKTYLKEVEFTVCHFTNPEKQIYSLIVIVDEADEYVAKNAAVFKANGSLKRL
jgi:hypothetical protein